MNLKMGKGELIPDAWAILFVSHRAFGASLPTSLDNVRSPRFFYGAESSTMFRMQRTGRHAQRLAWVGLTLALVSGASANAAMPEPNPRWRAPGSPVAYFTFKNGRAWYHAIQVDLNRPEVRVGAFYSPRLTSIWSVARQVQPIAAMTGTFFGYESQQPVADVVIDGRQVARGFRGSALVVDWDNRVRLEDPPLWQRVDWKDERYVLRGLVRLVRSGQIAPNPQAQGFRDRRIWGLASRTAVGITEHNKLVMVATTKAISLRELGSALVSRGVVDGAALDGGGSTMMYHDGTVRVRPSRPLSTMLVVHQRPGLVGQNPDPTVPTTPDGQAARLRELAWTQSLGAWTGAVFGPPGSAIGSSSGTSGAPAPMTTTHQSRLGG